MATQQQRQLKKPLSPFLIYRKQVYESIRSLQPDLTVVELSKTIARMWNELDPTQKSRIQQEYYKQKDFLIAIQFQNKQGKTPKNQRKSNIQSNEDNSYYEEDSDSDDEEFKIKSRKRLSKRIEKQTKGIKHKQAKTSKSAIFTSRKLQEKKKQGRQKK